MTLIPTRLPYAAEAATPTAPMLSRTGPHKTLGKLVAVDTLSLRIAPGETYGRPGRGGVRRGAGRAGPGHRHSGTGFLTRH